MNKSTPTPPPPKEDDTETTTEEETETDEDSDDNATTTNNKEMAKTDIGPLLARSAQARDNSAEPKPTTTTTSYGRSRYGAQQKEESPVSKYSRSRTSGAVHEEEPPSSRYGYTSRFLNKSKSTAAVQPDDDEHTTKYGEDTESKYPSGRSRYMALKDRRQRLARSRSSHTMPDDDDVDEPISPTSSNPTAYLASRGYGSATSSGNDLARSRSTHALKSRENSPDRTAATEKDGAALSSWARYLKSKYGNRSGAKDKDTATSSATPSSSNSATARRLSLGLPLRSSTDLGSSDDDQKNMQGSPTTPTAVMAAAGRFIPLLKKKNKAGAF